MNKKVKHFLIGLVAFITSPIWGPVWFITKFGQMITGDFDDTWGIDNLDKRIDSISIDRNSSSYKEVNE